MSIFWLKIIAVICMTMDHLRSYSEIFPLWFSWVGRLAAPIFMFCTIQAFIHTRDRKKLMLRLYIASVSMGIIGFIIDSSNNFFCALFVLVVVMYLIEIFKIDKRKGSLLLTSFIVYQILIFLIAWHIPNIEDILSIVTPIFGIITGVEDGFATLYVISGVLIYLCIDSKIKLSICYTAFCIMYFGATTTSVISRCINKFSRMGFEGFSEFIDIVSQILSLGHFDVGGHFLTENYNWMMIFSLPFFLIYNGERGKSFKWFFYIYYPAHLIVLALIF